MATQYCDRIDDKQDGAGMHDVLHKYFSTGGNELISMGIVKKARDAVLGVQYADGVDVENANSSARATAAYNFLKERVKALPSSAGAHAITVAVNGLQYSVTLVSGVLTFNPISAPVGAVIGAAANAVRAGFDEQAAENKLKWFYARWNSRRDEIIDIDQFPDKGVEQCSPISLDVVEWVINPLNPQPHAVAGLNQAIRGAKAARYLVHNEIVDVVFAYCCHRFLKKHAEANSQKKVYGQVTVPLEKFGRYLAKKLPGFAATHHGDVDAVAELLVVHLSQCHCSFSRDLLFTLVGSKNFKTVYADIFSEPGKAINTIKQCIK